MSLFSLNAQTWCPPGATWWHDFAFFTTVGEVITTYEGDTTISGMDCQKLSSWMNGHEMGSNDPVEFQYGTFYTTVMEDVIRVVVDDVVTDTLFHFEAVIGSYWHGPLSELGMRYRYVVLDTGTTTLSNAPVRWWYMDVQLGMQDIYENFTYDTLYERIGLVNAFIIPSHTHTIFEIPPVHGANCYGDGEVIWSWVPWLNCAIGLSTPEIGNSQNALLLRPNPASGEFWIDEANDVFLLEDPYYSLHDGHGRLVRQAPLIDARLPIDLSGVPPGLYHVAVGSKSRTITSGRLMVE